jgi:hypothetical protein
MSSSHSDHFDRFAAECGLRITVENISAAPRDVSAPPADLDRYFLVSLSNFRGDLAPLRMVFVDDPTRDGGPTMRDVLWWLSSDSWAAEQSDRQYSRWAEMYQYAPDDLAARRLFDLHVSQAAALSEMLGEAAYSALLELYAAELEGKRNARSNA